MPITYKPKRVNPGIKKGDQLTYMATIVPNRPVDYKELCAIIADRSSLTESDITGVVLALVHELERKLSHGCSVQVDELGIFSPSITSKQVNHPDHLSSENVSLKDINFRASPRLKQAMKNVKFVRQSGV